jgi:hypothetical protein
MLVTLNELGRRIGESHPRSKLTDHEVDLVISLIDPPEGEKRLSYAQVAAKLEVSKSCIAHIGAGRRRCQVVHRVVTVAR